MSLEKYNKKIGVFFYLCQFACYYSPDSTLRSGCAPVYVNRMHSLLPPSNRGRYTSGSKPSNLQKQRFDEAVLNIFFSLRSYFLGDFITIIFKREKLVKRIWK